MREWLPQEIEARFVQRWGFEPTRVGREWHSQCPWCGGRDRFVVFPNGWYYCRPATGHCGRQGWLDDDQPWSRPTPEQTAQWERQRQADERRHARDVQRRLYKLRAEAEALQHQEWQWIAVRYFLGEGISLRSIQEFGLGYTPAHRIKVGNEFYTCPAYTIPIRSPISGEIVNMQFRLVDPPAGVGRYRQVAGIPASAFFAQPRVNGIAWVCEGAKKALVLFEFGGRGIQVVGLPGHTVREELLDGLRDFETIYLMLDPDAQDAAEDMAAYLAPRVRVVSLPDKPDDLVRSGLTYQQFEQFLRYARKVGR